MMTQNMEHDEQLTALLLETMQQAPIPEAVTPAAMTEALHTGKRRRITLSRRGEFRAIAALCAGLLLVAVAAGSMDWSKKPPLVAENCYLETAGSYHKLYRQLCFLGDQATRERSGKLTNSLTLFQANRTEDTFVPESVAGEAGNDLRKNEVGASAAQGEHKTSQTITQVAGVQEADVIQTDGDALYYLFDDQLWYVPVSEGQFGNATSQQIPLAHSVSQTAVKLFFADGMATVLYRYETDEAETASAVVTFTADKQTQSLTHTGTFYQDGSITDARMIDKTLYLISQESSRFTSTTKEKDYREYIPCCGSACNTPISADRIFIPDQWDGIDQALCYTIVSAIPMDASTEPVTAAFAGASGAIYMNQQSLYLSLECSGGSRITRVALADGTITPKAVGTVDGYVLNQYSMSEYENCFRVATHGRTNTLYTFDLEMQPLGSVSFAPTETIQSVNFVGTRGYVVTFRQTDPLFSIDCSNPSKPVIDDAYKVSGYSTFLYPWGDLLLSFGVEQTLAINGLKLMMYQTAEDGTLTMLSDAVMGDLMGMSSYSSPAVNNFHALYLNQEENLIGVPVCRCVYDEHFYETNAAEEFRSTEIRNHDTSYYQFYRWENGSFQAVGSVSILESYADVMRCVSIDGYLYCCADGQIVSADMQRFEPCSFMRFR